jgi:hypothetical protein
MKVIAALCAVLVTGASCTTAQQSQSQVIFASPNAYVGKVVVVCGSLSGVSYIVETKDDVLTGLSILVGENLADPVRQLSQRTRACLSGTVEHLGCGSSAICTDWAYEYAIRVNRIH